MTTIASFDELPALVGRPLGASSWIRINQNRIDAFAAVTDDHGWIHTDPVTAGASGFRGTIAHGFLTLSLLTPLCTEMQHIQDATSQLLDHVEQIEHAIDRSCLKSPRTG